MRAVSVMHTVLAVILAMTYCEGAVAQQLMPLTASAADEWNARSSDEKRAYLEGYCSGAATTDTGRLSCGDEPGKLNPNTASAFCGQIYPSFGKLPGGKGLSFVDAFYKDRTYSDIPFWGAVRVFNDKACSENRVTSSLAKLQQQFLCLRQASDMAVMGIQGNVLKAQNEKCSRYR